MRYHEVWRLHSINAGFWNPRTLVLLLQWEKRRPSNLPFNSELNATALRYWVFRWITQNTWFSKNTCNFLKNVISSFAKFWSSSETKQVGLYVSRAGDFRSGLVRGHRTTHCSHLEFSKQKNSLRHSYSCLHKFYFTRYPWFETKNMPCFIGKEAFLRKDKAWVQTKERTGNQHWGHRTPTAVSPLALQFRSKHVSIGPTIPIPAFSDDKSCY